MKPYKCVVVTPAGRKRYLEILLQYILKEKDFIDEYRIWVNTHDREDLEYIHSLAEKYSFIKLDFSADHDHNKGNAFAIHRFFKNCIDENTVYIRLDDDIVWMEDKFLQKMYDFRINNPQYFLVYGNIINNAIQDHIRQRFGCFEQSVDLNQQIFEYLCTDHIGWQNSSIALLKHKKFISDLINNNIEMYKFTRWILFFYERVSINCISWLGKTFKEFDGNVGVDEEQWLSHDKPRDIKMPNCINGQALCSHFAFYTQRLYLDSTDILKQYGALASA